jgi:4'-phosphopantetheinyl transferase
MAQPDLMWISARQVADGMRLAGDAATYAILADVGDAALTRVLALDPTPQDLADMGRPIAGPRDHFLSRRALLRAFVAMRSGCAPEDVIVAHDAAGAPRVVTPEPGPFVSVAARGLLAGLAVSEKPVGIDIEPCGPAQEPVWHVLHPDERADVEDEWRTGRDGHFRAVWVAKEAYLKAIGTGLTRDPAGIRVRFDGPSRFHVIDGALADRVSTGVFAERRVGAQRVACACVVAG